MGKFLELCVWTLQLDNQPLLARIGAGIVLATVELTRLALVCTPIGLALYGAYRLIVG